MASGMGMLLSQVIKMLPPETLQSISQIGETVAKFAAQLDRIEANQRLILSHLGLDPHSTEKERDGQLSIGNDAPHA